MYKATIVIPNINGKGWLKDSIESVYAQTEQNFRLIVVDNGSTDESLEQARSYCSRENFTLIENGTNTGFSHAVNQGIALQGTISSLMLLAVSGRRLRPASYPVFGGSCVPRPEGQRLLLARCEVSERSLWCAYLVHAQ